MSNLIIVDVESNGPCPGLYSMVSFGAVVVDGRFQKTFRGELAPITDDFIPDTYKVIGVTREQHLGFPDPEKTMKEFDSWVREISRESQNRVVMFSDNIAFDWQFINYYFHRFVGNNPLGFSGRRIGDLYAGYTRDMYGANKWKHLRDTKHSHDPLDDAIGNAEALWKIISWIKGTKNEHKNF